MNVLSTVRERAEPDIPAYIANGNECQLFETAWTRRGPATRRRAD